MEHNNSKDFKRLFFGAEVAAPWPDKLPAAHLLPIEVRHITLSFLGNIAYSKLQPLLKEIPVPAFKIEPAAWCDKIVFLPPDSPRVIATNVKWFTKDEPLLSYQKDLAVWLDSHQFKLDKREFFPHVTLARAPFRAEDWENAIETLPLQIKAIHLYESLGNLTYVPLWSHHFHPAFTEIDHTADIAFTIYGSSVQQLHLNAKIALAFKFPRLLNYFGSTLHDSLDDIIIDLNYLIAQADAAIGCPFKAVSFHGNIIEEPSMLLKWEMIVDV